MTTLLVRAADWCATFDDDDTELAHADVLVEDGVIAAVGVDLDADADRIVDGRGLVLLPGLINSHQHLYQGACRAVPHLERALIGPWLAGLGALVKGWWRDGRFGPDAVGAISAAVLTESLLGGVTTVADQHYFFPAGASLDYVEATVDAAREVGVRLHACRGSITDGPDPDVTQSVDEVVRHCEALIAVAPRPVAVVTGTRRARAVRPARRPARAVRRARRARRRPRLRSASTPTSTSTSTTRCAAPVTGARRGSCSPPTAGPRTAPGWRTW